MSRILLYTILGCVLTPLNALAVWEYSLAAQVAMYDAVENRCASVDPDTFRKKYAEALKRFTPEEQSEMAQVRQSAEYRAVLTEASQDLDRQIAAAGEGGAAIVCKDLMQRL